MALLSFWNLPMTLRVRAVKTEGRYLKPGHLYSDKGPEFWSTAKTNASLYLCLHMPEADDTSIVYRIHVEAYDESAPTMNPHLPPGMIG